MTYSVLKVPLNPNQPTNLNCVASVIKFYWVLSHWAHFTVLDSFLYCVLLCVVCMIA